VSPLLWVLAAGLGLLVAGNVFELRAGRGAAGSVALGHARARAKASVGDRLLRRPSNGTLLFAGCSLLYLIVGAYLVIHRGSIVGDAESRVAQAWYVIASRDPHIAAIGFVWNPLPSVAAIPLVAIRGIWPALSDRAFAGCVVSALCMGGAVVHLRAALREMGAPTAVAVTLTACFALNPMTIYYGSNGMSEAMYLLFLVATTRYLLAWSVTGELRPLVLTAIFLALAYLTRYETVAAAITVMLVVFIVGTNARDHARSLRERMAAAVADLLVVGTPVVGAFLAWTIVSWVITGQPFQQFTSRYGNASILASSGGSGGANGTGWPKAVLAIVQILSYAPLAIPVLVIAGIVCWQRRDRRILALGVLAAPLAFSFVAYVGGQTFGFLRYYIPVLPLYLLLGGLLLSRSPQSTAAERARHWFQQDRIAGIAVALLLGVPGIFGSVFAMTDVKIGPAEKWALAWIPRSPKSADEVRWHALEPSGRTIAHSVDRLGLADSAVAVDTFDCGSIVVLASKHPHQFVITSDRDFERIVADPVTFHVPYLLVPNGDTGIEAIGVAHPGIYAGGIVGGLRTEVVGEYATKGCPTYRLLHVIDDGA
jgi:hypothetical protein